MITITYEELFTYRTLYRAHIRSRRCKRDKRTLVRFEMSMLAHLQDLYREISVGTFKFGKYVSFSVFEPKEREIQTQPYKSRVVQHVICDDMLMPYFSKRAITDNCVCQPGKGMHFALNRFENLLRAHINRYGVNGYFFRGDVLKYFASIPHAQLKARICGRIADARIRKIIEDIIDGYHTKSAFLEKYGIPFEADGEKTGRGAPIGNQTSQVFGMYYLDPLDRLVKETMGIKVYSRYMDDFVLLHPDLEFVKRVSEEIVKTVESLGLTLNSKTQIFPMKNGVTYLGFRFSFTDDGKIIRTVKRATKKRRRSRARLLKKAYNDGLIPAERVKASKTAIHGHLAHGNGYRFEKEMNERLDFIKEEDE